MIPARVIALAILVLALALAITACGSTPAPTATATAPTKAATPTAVATVAPSPTPVPPSPTAAPTATPKPAAPSATTAAAATTTAKPAATDQAAGGPLAELLARAKGTTEYSYDYTMSLSSTKMAGKAYVKGSRMRQEMDLGGIKMVTLMDFSKKVAYTLLPDGKTATKMDLSATAAASSQTPGDQVSSLPADAKVIGTETVDGKPATIIQVTVGGYTQKYWVWTERGLPLKLEMNTGSGLVTAQFSNYKFGPQADNLFELPAGVQITEGPTGAPGTAPTPKQ